MGKSKGKKAGKILLTVGSFFLGAGGVGQHLFGMVGHSFGAGIMAASLVGTVWNVAASRKMGSGNSSSPSIQRFDKAQESMSSEGQVPVVYGMRKISGNQTYHWTNAEQNTLRKHVVLCEGGIEGIVSVCANDLLIPTGEQSQGTVFTIQNVKYEDAKVWKDGKTLHLYANGEDKTIYLCNKGDAERADTFYEWQANTNSLISYINRMHMGWQAFPYATTSKYPGDLSVIAKDSAYMTINSVTADTVTGGTKYTFHDNEPPENYEEVGGYPNMAWLDMTFQTSNELNGNPSVDCIVKGRKIYDPRTKQTAYSTNPALCLLDFLTNKRYGLGRWISTDDIDIDSFIEAANYCDEEVTVYDADDSPLTSKRYELNMVIDARQDASQWLQDILANFSAWLVVSKDKIKLMVEQKSPIVHKFNDNNITSMTITPVKASDTPNRYEISLCDPSSNWRVIQVVSNDYSDQKQRGKVIAKQVELSGVTSQSQALRLARFYSDYNLSCPIVVTFTTGIEAMALEPGDVISISYRDTFKEMPVRISEIKETEDSEFEITARQYNGDIYNDDLGGGITWHSYVSANTPSAERRSPSHVADLTASTRYRTRADGSVGYDVIVSFKLPRRYDINTAVVSYRTNIAIASDIQEIPQGVALNQLGFLSPWKSAGESRGNIIIPNVHVGDEYEFRVQSKSDEGMLADEKTAPRVKIAVAPKTTVPSNPQNLQYNFSEKFLFFWDGVPDADLLYYEIRTNDRVGENYGLLGRTQDRSIAVSLDAREGKVYVFAINSYKRASYPAIVSYKYPRPKAPTELTVNKIPRGVSIVAPPLPQGASGVIFYITGTSYSKSFRTENTVLNFMEKSGIYDVKACYYDRMGEGEMSQIFAAVIEPTFPEEWIQDGSLSIAKFDDITQKAVSDVKDSAKKLLEIDKSMAELTKTNSEIVGRVQSVESQTASQITQMSNEIDFKIADSRKGLAADVKLNADKIQQVVTDLNADPSKSEYSAITQLVNGINARVAKGDVINQINMTSNGTVIDGKYLHVTGKTKFDDDVITEGMIKAGAITADKLAAGSISADRVNVKELSALSARIGLLRTKETGARVEISDNLIKVYDDNNILRVKLGVW